MRTKRLLGAIALVLLSIAYFTLSRPPSHGILPTGDPDSVLQTDLVIAEDTISHQGDAADVLERIDAVLPEDAVDTNATVVRVIDGDTIIADVDGIGQATIRLLGVNTPETVDPRKPVECFGNEASAFTRRTLAEGLRVFLAADPRADEVDKYGRLLRNIILGDGTDVNAMLIREGYAYAYTSFPLTPERKRELTMLQDEARELERGLWSPDACGAR